MKKRVFLKSTIRQPIHSLFILLLVGVISFAFAARIGEYSLITQEQERLSNYYRSVGTLISTTDSRIISDEVDSYLKQAPYVSYTDHRQYTSGVMQDVYNADNSGNLIIFVTDENAELISHLEIFFYGIYQESKYSSTNSSSSSWAKFTVDEVISGYPEYIDEGKEVFLYVNQEAFGDSFSLLKSGERYLLHASMDPDSIHSLSINNSGTSYCNFAWKPLTADLGWFLPAPSNLDLTQSQYAQLTNRIQQSHDNACALDIVATADMSAIPSVNPQSGSLTQYFLIDGRWLNREDDLACNQSIVIHEALATARELKIGDSINLKLRDASLVSPTSGRRYAPLNGYQFELQPVGHEYQTQTESFEIVGIYRSINPNSSGTSAYQRAYIPLSVFPGSFEPALPADDPEVYGLVLDSPAHEEAFQAATQSDLAAMGYYITFTPNGYQNFKNATEGIGAAARSNVMIFAAILILCFCLTCFVYFRFRRKDLAISQALGVPAGTCIASSTLPLLLVGGVGVISGAVLAWNYTQQNAETLLSSLVEAASAEGATATLSTGTLLLLILVLLATLLVLALIFVTVTVRKPVLSQLQGGGNKR